MTAQSMTRFAAAVSGTSAEVARAELGVRGEFAVEAHSGRGDQVVPLPLGARAGVVEAVHAGWSNFVIEGLDSSGRPCGDLLVNRIGRYTGVTAFGLSVGSGGVVQLRVIADGGWILQVRPLASAPLLELPSAGAGDSVLRYEGETTDWVFAHGGRGNVIVQQSAAGMTRLSVNEIGPFQGLMASEHGPSVLAIRADGPWSITNP